MNLYFRKVNVKNNPIFATWQKNSFRSDTRAWK